jgi:hypothetical protein
MLTDLTPVGLGFPNGILKSLSFLYDVSGGDESPHAFVLNYEHGDNYYECFPFGNWI